MDTKHRLVQLLGIMGLVSGCLVGLLAMKALIFDHVVDAWGAMNIVFAFAAEAYLISLGIRGLRWARGKEVVRSAAVKWGRVLLGAWLIFVEAKNHFHPAANLLQPSNEIQANGMNAAAIGLSLLGTWLLISGVLPQFRMWEKKSPDNCCEHL